MSRNNFPEHCIGVIESMKEIDKNRDAEVIKEYKIDTRTKSLAKKFNIHKSTVLDILKRNGIKHFGIGEQSNRKYAVDDNFFNKIDEERKAYWLGFIAADGFVENRKSKNKVLKITLSEKDKEHLRKFLNDVKSTNPLHVFQA